MYFLHTLVTVRQALAGDDQQCQMQYQTESCVEVAGEMLRERFEH